MAGNPFKDEELTTLENVVAAWPLVIVFVGGAIGGICGALAWQANVKIFKTGMAGALKYFCVFLSGLAGLAIYLIVVAALVLAFPGLAQ